MPVQMHHLPAQHCQCFLSHWRQEPELSHTHPVCCTHTLNHLGSDSCPVISPTSSLKLSSSSSLLKPQRPVDSISKCLSVGLPQGLCTTLPLLGCFLILPGVTS